MTNRVSLAYYIGAGASAKSLPLVSHTPSRMRDLAKELSDKDFKLDDAHHRCVLEGLCNEMRRMGDRATPSIDVLARRYHLLGNELELRRLEATLSAFFVLEQSRRPPDPRYVDFFAYLAEKDAKRRLAMPTDIRIVSWNCDMQFEKSFAEFIPILTSAKETKLWRDVTDCTYRN